MVRADAAGGLMPADFGWQINYSFGKQLQCKFRLFVRFGVCACVCVYTRVTGKPGPRNWEMTQRDQKMKDTFVSVLSL